MLSMFLITCSAHALSGGSPSAFPPPLSSVSLSPSRIGPPGTTAEDLLSRVLGRASPALASSRLRTGSDATLAPFPGSPLVPASSLQQNYQSPNHTPTSSTYFQAPPPVGAGAFTPPGVAFRQDYASAMFNRAVGGPGSGVQASNQYQAQNRTGSFADNGTTAIPYSPSSLAGVTPFAHRGFEPQYQPLGSPRGINPLGAIGASLLPNQSEMNVYGASHPEQYNLHQYEPYQAPIQSGMNRLLSPGQIRPDSVGHMSDHRPWS